MDILPITVVLPSYNRYSILKDNLQGYLDLPVEKVILVDDASTDESASLANEFACPKFTYHRNEKRRYQPGARNVGMALSDSDYILMGEDDVIMDESYVRVLFRKALELDADFVAGRLIAMQRGETVIDARERSDADGNKTYVFVDTLTADCSTVFDAPLETPFLHACSLFKHSWAKQHEYDETFTGNALREETDFYFTCFNSGAKLYFCSEAVAFHMFHDYEGGCRGSSIRYATSSIINNHRFLKKHWGTVQRLLKIERSRMMYEIGIDLWMIRLTFLFWMNASMPNVHRYLKRLLKRS